LHLISEHIHLSMKTKVTQQEILLMTGTAFSSRFNYVMNEMGQSDFSIKEQLVSACWNGVLPELLPEIFDQKDGVKKLFVWKIHEIETGIELEMCESPDEKDIDASILPNYFLPGQNFN
jgi:hypothetical protein